MTLNVDAAAVERAMMAIQGDRYAPDPMKMIEALPTLSTEGGFVFLTCKENNRLSIATSIERLIDMLDALEPDCDLEPDLGSGDDREADYPGAGVRDAFCGVSDAEPYLGWNATGAHGHNATFGKDWGDLEQECEDEAAQCEDEGAVSDEEFTLGWSEEQSLSGFLSAGAFGMGGEMEPDLGWPEQVDQVRRNALEPGWKVEDGEPELGWTRHGAGCTDNEPRDDREGDDERAPNGDEGDYDGGEVDHAVFTPGGGSVSQGEDGWQPAAGSAVAPMMLEEARILPNGDIAREIIKKRNAARLRRAATKAPRRVTTWPAEFDGRIPEIRIEPR